MARTTNTPKRHLAPLIGAAALLIAFFAAPIITVTVLRESSSLTLYDALIGSLRDAQPDQLASILVAAVLVIGALVLYAARGLGILEERYAQYADAALFASILPLVLFHATMSAQDVSFLGFPISQTSIAFGAFLPAIIGIFRILTARALDRIAI